jgi:serine/threonine protein kinase
MKFVQKIFSFIFIRAFLSSVFFLGADFDFFTRFTHLLPENRTLGAETAHLIRTRFTNEMMCVTTADHALDLFERAVRHPRRSTMTRLERNHRVIVDGDFTSNSIGTATMLRAFDADTGACLIVKMSDYPEREYAAFSALELDWNAALESNIVPMKMVIDLDEAISGKSQHVLVMPFYSSPLQAVPHFSAELVHRGTMQILHALQTFHSHGVFHMDVKSGNVLLDAVGNWYLCDFDSCVFPGGSFPPKLTSCNIPLDLPRHPSARFDRVLLVVMALLVLDSHCLSLGHFTLHDLETQIEIITFAPLKLLLTSCLEQQ